MESFRPQISTRLRSGGQNRDPEDHRIDEQNIYEAFDERRTSYDDSYPRSRSRSGGRQKVQESGTKTGTYTSYLEGKGSCGGGGEKQESQWERGGMLGQETTSQAPPTSRDSAIARRLHQQLSALSSSPSSDDEEGINSDATFTGSEVALARDSTLVLPCRRLTDSTSGLINSSHTLSMNKASSKGQQNLGSNSGANTLNRHIKDRDPDFTSCLSRTPSGSVFIPSDIPKLPASLKKSDINATHSSPLTSDEKNSDRCHLPYPSSTSVPVIPVRNNLRRPVSSRFSHSRFHFRKTLSRCSWKCTAISFMLVSLALLTSLAYFIAVAVLNFQYASRHPCPVMIEDMSETSDGANIKSTYPPCDCNFPSSRSRKIRDVESMQNSIDPRDPFTTTVAMPTKDLDEMGSGDIIDVPFSTVEVLVANPSDIPDVDLSEDYVFITGNEEAKSKMKREKDFLLNDGENPDTSTSTSFLEKLNVMASPEALTMQKVFAYPEDHGSNMPHQEESVIEPPILLPSDSESEIPGKVRYPEYEPVDKVLSQTVRPPTQIPIQQPSTAPTVPGVVKPSTEHTPLTSSTEHTPPASSTERTPPASSTEHTPPASSTEHTPPASSTEHTLPASSTEHTPASSTEQTPPTSSTTSSSELEFSSSKIGVNETLSTSTFLLPDTTTLVPDRSTENASSFTETTLLESFTEGCCACRNASVDVEAHDSTPLPPVQTALVTTSPSSLPSKTLPPQTEAFSEAYLGKLYSHKVDSFGHWNIHFQLKAPSLVRFNYSVSEGASIGVYGRKNSVPTHTRYDFAEILDTRKKDNKRSAKDLYAMEFVQFLDQGSWYISVYNDGENAQQVAFVPYLTDQSGLPCPYDCHGHGTCALGNCVCEPDYAGESCADRVCPVLCSGRGYYSSGECFCNPSWKGKECQLREDECEVNDCNGHGDCIDGFCRCFPGYKGFHCEEVDCLDPGCSEHGICVNGMCICRKGWKGADCSEADSDSLRCLPDCSEHGHFDVDHQRCVCDGHWTGPDCSQELCSLDCGSHGRCQGNICICESSWSGSKCDEKQCDPRCLEHGQCSNGTCLCIQGWNGQYCTLEGCPQNCHNRGSCMKVNSEWQCKCEDNWSGSSCSVPLEKICDDKIDNDNDGLVDCADSECCKSKACESNPLCFSSPSPLDILLRKQPPAVTASFFQRMQFLIEEGSVQSYAHKNVFNDSRASVIRGCVVSTVGSGLKGIRVAVTSDHRFGFTITRDTGWFDLMVNGGGAVTLEFKREPFMTHEKTVVVPWNEIIVVDKIVMKIKEDNLPDYRSTLCTDHDYDNMKPVVLATWKHGFQGGCPEKSSILAESQVVQESLSIPGTNLHLVYHSSRMGGYLSTIQLRLTPDEIPSVLRYVHLRITIEGILFDKMFEAAPGIKFTYSWDRRNIYRQKVYGAATATVHVGYEYNSCPHIIWEVQTTEVSGHDMSISEIGGWNLDIHHRYNFHEGILQKGDGTNVYLKNKPKVLTTAMGDGHQRPMHCHQCNGFAKNQRLLAPVALAAAPDGSLYVGDFNLIRRIMPDGHVMTVVELSAAQVAYRYHLAVGPTDGKLYISDPEKHQVFKVIEYNDIPDVKNNIEAVIGSGSKCLPGDKLLCGDGRKARDAKLAYPKGLAVSAYGEMYIADGTNIRVVDRNGIIHTIIGDHFHKSHWKPFPCGRTVSLSQVNLRWPTELAINPLDDSLHILDDHIILRLTPDKRLKVIAGRPLQCPIVTTGTEKSDIATETYLVSPQSISFSPKGDLYIAESDPQTVNRVRVVGSDGRISTFAGAESKCSCLDVNCKCFDEERVLASNSLLSTISSIAITPDGCLHICDQGNLRIRSVVASLPKANELGEFHIYSSETQEVYVFNRHGQHISTRNILTGRTMYLFSYNVNTSLGKLSTVTDEAGNKIYILRDYSNQVNTIENTQGGKCHLEISRMHMLQGFTTPDNFKTSFEYLGSTGLLRGKIDSARKSFVYSYDTYGRLTHAVTPTGQIIKLNYNLSTKGASVTVTGNDQDMMSLLIRGLDVTTRTGDIQQRITQYQDGSLILALDNALTIEMETVPSPAISDESQVLGEIFPVPAKLRAILSEDVIQKFEWKYYLRREGKGKNRQITQVGRKMKVNGDILVAVEFDRERYNEIVYDKNQIPLINVHYDELGRPIEWLPSQNITSVSLKYDKFGRLERWNRGSLSEHYSFDINGRLADVRYSDNSGIMYKYEDGPTVLPTEVILPSGSRYILQYDSVGSLQTIIMPNGHKHEIAVQISFGFYKQLYLSPGVRYPYIVQFSDQGQILAKYLPKNRGRVLNKYNSGGLLSTKFCGNERIDFHYYENRSLLKNIVKFSSGLETKTDYRYHGSLLKEERHRFSSRSGLDGARFKYIYDGRLTSIVVEINGKGSTEAKLKYNAETGVLEQTQHFIIHRPKINSIFIQDEMRQYSKTIGLDAYGRIVVLAVTLWNKEIYSLNLQYDNRSRVKQSHMKIGRDAATKVANYTYTLDGFLEEVVGTDSWKYTYDINGNMNSFHEGQHQESFRYDSGDRLVGVGDRDVYTVDYRGFITQRGDEKFVFNPDGHLIHSFQLHQYEGFYFYDHQNRLISRRDHRGNITQYFYADPMFPNRLTHLHYPKDEVTFVYTYDCNNHLMYIQQGGLKYYVASDHLGTPVALFNAEGNIMKEMYRTPFGKVIFDSNPDFYLPIDFQGGIRDPITQLIFFNGRTYDPYGSQWLTPDIDAIPHLLKAPYNMHLHRFHANDPINVYKEAEYLTDLKDWLAIVGFDTEKMLVPPQLEKHYTHALPLLRDYLPVISGMGCVVDVISAEFQRFSTVHKTDVKVNGNTPQNLNSRVATIQSVLGDGILLSYHQGRALVSTVFDSSTILKDVILNVFNDTSMLDLHFCVNGQDLFYFVQEDGSRSQRNWDQLQRLGAMFNVTMHNVDPDDGPGQVDIKIQSPSMMLNVRYGSTVADERLRLMRAVKRRAIDEAWQVERELLKSGHKGMYEWSLQDKEELLSSGFISRYHGAYIHNIEEFPELSDDPFNIIFKKEGGRKRRNRPRKPK